MKAFTFLAIICLAFSPTVFTNFPSPAVKGYLTPTTGKWLYPDNDEDVPESEPAQIPGTVTATDPTNVEIVEQMLTGFSQQVNVDVPTNAESCLDENSAIQINKFFYSLINKLANSDFMTIPIRTKRFQQSIEPSVFQCLDSSLELDNVLDQYGVGEMSLNTFYYKLANYTFDGNYQALVDQASDIRSAYENQSYENAGLLTGRLLQAITGFQPQIFSPVKAAVLHYSPFVYLAQTYSADKRILLNAISTHANTTFQDLLGSDDDFSEDDDGQNYKRDLRDLVTGALSNVNLKEKYAHNLVGKCFNEDDAKLVLDSLAQSIAQIQARDVYNVPNTVNNVRDNISSDAVDCLNSSPEAAKLIKAYGLEGKNATYVYNQIDGYIQKNGYQSLEKAAKKVRNEIRYAGTEVAGEKLGKILNAVLSE